MTWIDRYLSAVLRSIPEPKRADVQRELRSSIEDAIEERAAGGESRDAAERAVLEGLGDPSALAGAYTGQPSYLLGPELFPLYRKFVPRLLFLAVPVAAVVVLALDYAGGADASAAVQAAVAGAINVGIQVAFWATVTFVFLEWAGPARQARAEIVATAGRWTLERLPKASNGRISVGEAAGEIVTVLVTLGILLFLAGLSATSPSGAAVPLLAPAFSWPWLPVLFAMIALRAVVHALAYATGRWTTGRLVYHALLQAMFAVVVVVLALGGSILNPAFGEAIGWPDIADGSGPVMLMVAVGTVLASGWEVLRVLLRWHATNEAAPVLDASARSA